VELLLNAVEHGNLEIGYEAKRDLVERDALREEVERRLADDKYKNRKVTVVLSRREDGVYVVVTDEGVGFKPQPFLTLDPSRAASRTGRGIAHARVVSFDKLAYNAIGNQVVCAITSGEEFNW
jgi:hypothetical protein